MPFCTQCGKARADSDKFCAACGAAAGVSGVDKKAAAEKAAAEKAAAEKAAAAKAAEAAAAKTTTQDKMWQRDGGWD